MNKHASIILALLMGGLPVANAMDINSLVKTAETASGQKQNSSKLIQDLTTRLGITPAQASGGAAALLSQAKNGMKPADFSKLTSAVPEIASLLDSNVLGTLAQGLSLEKQFASLGLDSNMIGQFKPIILDYVKELAGPQTARLLASAL